MNPSAIKALSIKELRERLQSTAPEAGRETFVGQTVRFFSIYFTKFLALTPVTPNQLTSISVVIFLMGVSLFAFGVYWINFLAIFIVYFSIIIDACDGEIARLKGGKSGNIGAIYTEPISHDIQYGLMFIPLVLGVFLKTGDILIVFVGYIATIAKLLHRFMQIRFWYVVNQAVKGPSGELEDTKVHPRENISFLHRVYKFFNRNIFSSVGQVIPMIVFALFDRMDLFVWFFALGFLSITLANFIRQVVYISRVK